MTREVPPVLLSGDHGAIAAWRHQQRLERTAARRPDLLHASAALRVRRRWRSPSPQPSDAGELTTLQRACWVSEARANDTHDIPPLVESVDEVAQGLRDWQTWVVREGGRLVGLGPRRGRTPRTPPSGRSAG